MVVAIPCTRLSKRILEEEYGKGPIKLSRKDLLWPILRPLAPGDSLGGNYVEGRRSELLEIETSRRTANLLLQHASDAGVVLHRFHLRDMMKFMEAHGAPYKDALRKFQLRYNISDDDYDLDSGYRQWLRYKRNLQKKQGKRVQKNSLPVTLDAHTIGRNKPTELDLKKLVDFITYRLRYLRPDLPNYIYRQVEIWLWRDYGRRHYKEVMVKLGLSRRQVNHSCRRIRGYVQHDFEFARLVDPTKLFS